MRVLNKNKNTIVYGYIHYHPALWKSLLWYILSKNMHGILNEWGHYLTIWELDPFIIDPDHLENTNKEIIRKTSYNKEFNEFFNRDHISKYDLFHKIFNKLILYVSHEDSSIFVDLAFKKDYLNVIKYIAKIIGKNSWIDRADADLFMKDKKDQSKFNILHGCVFMVSDLNLFINSIKEKGYEINQETSSIRSQVTSIDSFLLSIDKDFRDSLYNHYNYHLNSGSYLEYKRQASNGKFNILQKEHFDILQK